jgi:D-glycero-beta-D-manno-heptose 1-phosphate adenylyltransferase
MYQPHIIPWSEVSLAREAWRYAGKRVVVTNGCFDLLHVGHLRYLSQAKALGDILWVGVNADESVRSLKGPTRPIHAENERAELLSGLRVVDAVTIFTEKRATRFIERVSPDLYVKGGDYTPESLDPEERAALLGCRAVIRILPLVPGKSTTATLLRLQPSAVTEDALPKYD